MINASIGIAISGLQAASARLNNSANNVANIHSTTSNVGGERVMEAFKPQQVTQTSLSSGGVQADLRAVDPATVPVYDPENIAANEEGITEYPNVDLEEEVVNQQIAKYDYKANLKVIETADEMMEDLLDITA